MRGYFHKQRFRTIACSFIAVGFHIVALATWSISNPYGAADEGEGGVEVGVGLLGVRPENIPTVPEPIQEDVSPLPPPVFTPEPPTPLIQDLPVNQLVLQVVRPTVEEEWVTFENEQTKPVIERIDESASQASTPINLGFGAGNSTTYGGLKSSRTSYLSAVSAHLNRHKIYPDEAIANELQGVAVLRLELLNSGSVKLAEIQSSSGVTSLDRAALDMVQRAQPFPPFPADLTTQMLRFNIPVTFEIERR